MLWYSETHSGVPWGWGASSLQPVCNVGPSAAKHSWLDLGRQMLCCHGACNGKAAASAAGCCLFQTCSLCSRRAQAALPLASSLAVAQSQGALHLGVA